MLSLDLRIACRHLAKAINHVESFMATVSLEAAQQQLDRHYQLGSGKVDETMALPGPVMKVEDLGKYLIDAAVEKVEAPKVAGGGTSARKMLSSPGEAVASRAEDVGKRYLGGFPFGGPTL
jgi:hypothetical protein